MLRRFLVLLSLPASMLVAAAPALAAWPHSPATNLVVSNAAVNQQRPVMVPDGAGGAIVAWEDLRGGVAYDIYAQHILQSGVVDPAWPANGRAICTATDSQLGPVIVSDGLGGAIIAWTDLRTASSADIYAQHVLATGAVDPAWPANGRALCTATFEQIFPAITTDGAGGAIVTWQDNRSGNYDVYAQHVLASGAADGAWPVNGRALCTAALDQSSIDIVSDGAGGAVLAWTDSRTGTQDIYAGRVLASGALDTNWPSQGLAVCTATSFQQYPKLLADGVGGAIVVWQDNRSGNNDVYAQRVLAAGYVDGGWPTDGRALCAAIGSQTIPQLVSDGAGGAVATWQDSRGSTFADVYAQHLLVGGTVDGGWPVDGRAISTAAGDQTTPMIVADGAGGAVITFVDLRSGSSNYDISAGHVLASGVYDSTWPVDGRALCTAPQGQNSPAIVSDDAGGAIVAWSDARSGFLDIYAQRVARFGVLGTPEPVIASVKDVPNDQGGKVKVSWDASWLDTDPSPIVDHYWIFRSVPPQAAAAALRGGARVTTALRNAPLAPDELLATVSATGTIYWEFLSTQQAYHILSGYSLLASTAGDSTGGNNASTLFMVTAWNAAGTQYWSSASLGGYSVDNVAPAMPAPFAGNYGGGATHLHWEPNGEADLAGYHLYRGGSAGFVPGPGNQIASPPDTGYADVGAAGAYYKLSAVDVHGNESGFALLSPTGTASVEDGMVGLALAAPWPNPSTGAVSLSLTLPAAGDVRLAIHDAAGRRVRQVLAGSRAAGTHTVSWNGRDQAGNAVPAGLYFVRLEAAGRVVLRRIARLD